MHSVLGAGGSRGNRPISISELDSADMLPALDRHGLAPAGVMMSIILLWRSGWGCWRHFVIGRCFFKLTAEINN
jgi:hypothetical protein